MGTMSLLPAGPAGLHHRTLPANAKHDRHARPIDIGIHEAYTRQPLPCARANAKLAATVLLHDTALSADHRDDIPYFR